MQCQITKTPGQKEQPREVALFAGRLTIISALQTAQNQISWRRPEGSSDPESPNYNDSTQLWDVYQRAIEAAQTLGSSPAGQNQGGLGWKVRERRGPEGDLRDCFVEAPQSENMAYGLEVLGDDYEGYGGVEAKLQHCQMIVAWANAEAVHE